ITFVNKVDRESHDPFELMDEIADALQLETAASVWPIGMGRDFHGCYDLESNTFSPSSAGNGDGRVACDGIEDERLDGMIAAGVLEAARENMELARAAYPEFDRDAYRAGNLTPVVFGSALRNHGVEDLIRLVAENAPQPRPSPADARLVEPGESSVTGFVFKVQANMDRNHRDRVAFLRVCSGRFERGMKLKQVRTGKTIMVHSPIFFVAQDREIAEAAGPGDVIGIPNHGTVRVGDTFTEGESLRFTGLPAFAPEILRRVRLGDTTRIKQLRQALEDLAEEGLIQLFKPNIGSQWIIGVVGVLQLDVLTARAAQEYRVDIDFEPVPFVAARWLRSDDDAALDAFIAAQSRSVVRDRDDAPVFLAASDWELNTMIERNAEVAFLKTKELE
ncbi:MAG: EF-Tu/IF-2/RF-3 family GTPase, partial [Methyloligellaceae bacterium]